MSSIPTRAYVVTASGVAVNLCLGILYAWSVWKAKLVRPAGQDPNLLEMTGQNAGWTYLTGSEATAAYSICGFTFALCMIVGGRLQDRVGPRVGATLGGLFLGGGCILAGLAKSFLGLVLGFGFLGGIGLGLGYAAATPAAVRWFGPHRRGLIAGLVVAGFGGAAIYIAPLARFLIDEHGLTGSFVGLGVLFAGVIVTAAQFLRMPPPGYAPPGPPAGTVSKTGSGIDWTAGEMARTWQFFALVALFFASAQAGLLVIASASSILASTAKEVPFFAANGWILASFGGLVNAAGRVGTGVYSDRVGRVNAYTLNGILSVCCLVAAPWVIATGNVPMLFLVVGVAFWQYGGTLSLMPALTADYFGARNLGLNYGLVFLGWGLAFFVPQGAEVLASVTGQPAAGFYLSAGLLAAGVLACRFLTRPIHREAGDSLESKPA